MKFLLNVLLWCILFALCWPLALAIIILAPIIWLISLPFKLLGFAFTGVFKFVEALFMLPFRLVNSLAK